MGGLRGPNFECVSFRALAARRRRPRRTRGGLGHSPHTLSMLVLSTNFGFKLPAGVSLLQNGHEAPRLGHDARPRRRSPRDRHVVGACRLSANLFAKSRFWYLINKPDMPKKSSGELLAVTELHDRGPTTSKNYGMWHRCQSRTNTNNMYNEFCDVRTLTGRLARCTARWPAAIHIARVGVQPLPRYGGAQLEVEVPRHDPESLS